MKVVVYMPNINFFKPSPRRPAALALGSGYQCAIIDKFELC